MPLFNAPQPIKTTVIAAGTATNTVIKASPGIFFGIITTTSAAGTPTVFDNATTNSGTPVGQLGASVTVGVYDNSAAGVPCVNGITVAGSASNPAMTILWS